LTIQRQIVHHESLCGDEAGDRDHVELVLLVVPLVVAVLLARRRIAEDEEVIRLRGGSASGHRHDQGKAERGHEDENGLSMFCAHSRSLSSAIRYTRLGYLWLTIDTGLQFLRRACACARVRP